MGQSQVGHIYPDDTRSKVVPIDSADSADSNGVIKSTFGCVDLEINGFLSALHVYHIS